MRSTARSLFGKLIQPKTSWRHSSAIASNELKSLRISLLGTCQMELIVKALDQSRHKLIHSILGSYEHSPIAEADDDDDLVIVNTTLRHILANATGLPLPASDMAFARLESPEAAQALLEDTSAVIDRFVGRIAQAYPDKPVIFLSFFETNFAHYGITQNPYSIMEPREFLRRLNAHMAQALTAYHNFYFIDINEILNQTGREFLNDDPVAHSTHASFVNDWDVKFDNRRRGRPRQLLSAMNYERSIRRFGLEFIDRIESIYRVLTQENPVKLIICDIDDTLWRGVAAEADDISDEDRIAGWPLGLVEAILFFKARGGLLALCSKNDLAETGERFKRIFGGALTLEDFAVARVNWERKSQNIAEILAETNLLAKNALFIDDNVREVAEAQEKHPDLRCLGTDHYNWRRTVLYAPETQVLKITDESRKRTALVQAMAARQAPPNANGHAAEDRLQWLSSLELRQSVRVIRNPGGKDYDRAFELLNKTNQFNTTGKRWSSGEMQRFSSSGGEIYVSSLADKNIDNGLIAVCLVKDDEIVQMVLSCRVFGLDAEKVLGATAVDAILKKHPKAFGKIIDTGKNKTSHSYFSSLGFTPANEGFEIAHQVPMPSYIAVTLQ